jgi:hypothetical protein
VEVLGSQERATLWGAIAVPVKVSTAGEFPALLAKETFPDEVPAACGVNVTVNDTLFPAATVTGNVMPLTE